MMKRGLLWSKGLLGDKTAQSLVYTIYFYIGKIFGLRACEYRQLRLSNFVIENNKICYRENISKTFHGGLKDLKKKPRMVITHYCHEDEESVHEPCLVQIFKQYISLVGELSKIVESFYFRPSKTAYKFGNAPIGNHKLNSIVPFLMKEVGLEIKTAHCLRVTTATNLFRAGHQDKLIRERTGHVSSALFTYEKLSNDQAIAVSKCVGPSVSKVVSLQGPRSRGDWGALAPPPPIIFQDWLNFNVNDTYLLQIHSKNLLRSPCACCPRSLRKTKSLIFPTRT